MYDFFLSASVSSNTKNHLAASTSFRHLVKIDIYCTFIFKFYAVPFSKQYMH